MEDDQFTLDEANSLIPWLEEIFQRLTPGRQKYLALRTRLEESGQDSGGSSSSSSSDDLAQSREEMDRLGRELQDGIEEILDRGIIFRDFEQGLVDFPSQREGREVYLCWIRGEDQIGFWHETDRGFTHRQPL